MKRTHCLSIFEAFIYGRLGFAFIWFSIVQKCSIKQCKRCQRLFSFGFQNWLVLVEFFVFVWSGLLHQFDCKIALIFETPSYLSCRFNEQRFFCVTPPGRYRIYNLQIFRLWTWLMSYFWYHVSRLVLVGIMGAWMTLVALCFIRKIFCF